MAVALLATAGCTGTTLPRMPWEQPTNRVSDKGFTVSARGVTVTGPAGVAPAGTEVTLQEVPAPPELAELELKGSPVLEIALAGGAQPATPVTMAWTIPEGMPTESVAFITAEGPGKPWRGVPVTISGNQATVQLDHFSWTWFGDGAKLVKGLADGVNAFFGQTYPAPAGCVQTLQIQGHNVTVKNSRADYVHACLTADQGKVVVTAASNSPYVFTAKTQKFATMRVPGVPLTLAGVATLAVAKGVHGDGYGGYLVPGGSVSVEYEVSSLAANPAFDVMAGEIDAGLGLVGVAVTGASMLSGTPLDEVFSQAAVVECMGSVVQAAGTASAVDAAGVVPGLMNCISTGASQLNLSGADRLSMATAVVGSLTGYLVTQIRGVADTLRGGSFTLTATTSTRPTPKPTPSPTRRTPTPTPAARGCLTSQQAASAIIGTGFSFKAVTTIECYGTSDWAKVGFTYGTDRSGEAYLRLTGSRWTVLALGGHGGDFYPLSQNIPPGMPARMRADVMRWVA